MVTECHLFSIGLTICDLMCILFVFLLYFQMDAKKRSVVAESLRGLREDNFNSYCYS